MLAWLVEEWCEPEGLKLTQVAEPEPGPGQVKVKVAAAALNFLDTLMIRGHYQLKPPLPFSPGVELSGEVAAVGEGVDLRVGDAVCGLIDYGAFAEYVIVDEFALMKIPADADPVEAATIPVVYPTAYCALRLRADIRAADYVLVHAGAGGMGIASIQLARYWGGRVIATAGGPEKVRICREQGAELAIDYTAQDWVDAVKEHTAGHGADIVVDMVGGEITAGSLRCLAWTGRLLIVGFAGGAIAEIPANRLLLKNASAMGVVWGAYRTHQPQVYRETLLQVMALYAEQAIRPVVSRVYDFDQAPLAIRDLGARETYGKVVLRL